MSNRDWRVVPNPGPFRVTRGRIYDLPPTPEPAPCRIPAAELHAALRDAVDCGHDVSLRAALHVILVLHPAEAHECPARDGLHENYTAYDSTCPTLLAIAEKLGVEVDGG